jgi:class 3 adenylate cyclase/pimeloyl-ACP methyl ester carboxylesterase
MDVRIEYATTADGVSIAYTSVGNGIPLVNPPPAMPWSNIEEEWQIPEWKHYYDHLTENFRIIRYDNRGAGLSTREVGEITLDTHLLDLEAVVDRLAIDRFVLFGLYYNAQIAVSYAVKHPERVSHLILWCPVPSIEDIDRETATQEAFERLMALDYNLFTETLAHTVFGWESGDAAHRLALYMQHSMSVETARRCWAAGQDIDVRDLLPKIQAPTLVVHRRDFKLMDIEVSKRVAARIPNARLAVLPGESLSPYMGDLRATLNLYNDFAGVDATAAAARQQRHTHPDGRTDSGVTFRTIMFTDMQESTALTQRLGDAKAQELVRMHNDIVEGALRRHGGTRIKHTGDGIMASFLTASSAVEAAVDIQGSFAERNEDHGEEPVAVRIGINAGEPVVEGDDLFGTSVQLASRVCTRAEAGEILTTDVVRQLVAGKGFLFADRGEEALRGFEDPVRLYEVRWRRDGA